MLRSAHRRALSRICCAEIEVDGLGSYPHIPGGRPHGSDSRAARRLGVNHATVARQLTALEQELKTQLVERRTTGCTLTSAGEALVAAAGRAESEFLQVGAHLGRASETISGNVRVGG